MKPYVNFCAVTALAIAAARSVKASTPEDRAVTAPPPGVESALPHVPRPTFVTNLVADPMDHRPDA